RCGEAGHLVEVQAEPNSGWVEARAEGGALWALTRVLRWQDLCFSRQLLWSGRTVEGMSPGDRVTPVVDAARALCDGYSDFLIETPDTDGAKSLS
ncbi:hypothetical protein NK983_27295, partial [Salmonella enterica subsp. enterica serovar Typhimurium]|nr:hypothetical protein [Salmonella enterica subsp. enterica serovar Typhimurium]